MYASGFDETRRASRGSTFRKYQWYPQRIGAGRGRENSQTSSCPPGRVTLANSARAAPGSTTLRRPNEIVTASKVPSANGRCSASPATLGKRKLDLAADSMPNEKSVATHQAPVAASAWVETPVPAA